MNNIYKCQIGKKLILEKDNTTIINPKLQAILFNHQANIDLNDMSEAMFRKKYNTSKHRFKYDKDIEYKNQVDSDAKLSREENGSIDYPSTDVRSKTFGGVPNMFFVTPNQQGTPLAKNLQEQTGEIVLAALPVHTIKIPKINLLKNLKFKPNPEMGYRALGTEGFDDLVKSGVVRAKQPPPNLSGNKINLSRGTNRNPNTGKLQGSLDRPYFADGFIDTRYGDEYIVEANKKLNNLAPIDTHLGISIPNPGTIPLENVNVYKKDWLRGYKKINIPTQSTEKINPISNNLLDQSKTISMFKFMDRSSLDKAGIPQTISEDKMLSKMKDIIETSESNAINYTNNPEYIKRFSKVSLRSGLNSYEKNPYQETSTPVFIFDNFKNLKSVSKYNIPDKKLYIDDLEEAYKKGAGGFANPSGIYIKAPSKSEVGLEKFALTMDHEMHHLDNYFYTPNENSMPLGESLKVLDKNPNYNTMVPEYHSYNTLFKDVIKNDKSWEASPVEIFADIYAIKQKYGIGSNGRDITDLEALKIYNKIPNLFREGASKENIIKFIKLAPSVVGGMYLYDKK